MRVFLDANILFTAAHNPSGKAAFVIELGNAGHFELFTSEYAREEAFRNLAVKYPSCLPCLEDQLRHVTTTPTNPAAPYPTLLTAKDSAIFQAAVTCKATHILTGDLKHFGQLMNSPEESFSIIVQTVADFIASLQL
ncbi:MAG: PIN domain-containing protein [Deltaproteobacteria bacterium]